MTVKISIIIATYNRCSDLKECLASILNLQNSVSEVIVVDSGSTDGTAELERYFPMKYVSIAERNREHARNVGISITKGDIVAFLDDDVTVSKEWLSHIAEPYKDKNVGGVGGRVIPHGESSNFYVKTSRKEVGKVFDSGLVIGNFDTPLENPVEVDSFIGCNMSFRRDSLLRIGGFDENYAGTGYRDDTDLCMRIRRLGLKLIYNPKALVWHKFRGKQASSEWVYWYARNHFYFYLKNLFPSAKTGFPVFFCRMFFPPRDYVAKSGVKIKIKPISVLNVFKGMLDGYRTWIKTAQVEQSAI